MKSLSVEFENCYGIKRLKADFDFRSRSTHAVYAPNGVMKSSFAQAIKDLSEGIQSRDRAFPERTTLRRIVDDNGLEPSSSSVVVLTPYDSDFGGSERTATLLVNQELREEYQRLFDDIEDAKGLFLAAMKERSRSKYKPDRLAQEISTVFLSSANEFYRALVALEEDVRQMPSPQLAAVPYDLIADEGVATFLKSPEAQDVLQQYIATYNSLLEKSKYFKKGMFDYYSASVVSDALKKNGFFRADHSLVLNSDSQVVIDDDRGLEEVVSKEKEAILNNEALKKSFADMEKRITKNERLRHLQTFISNNRDVLALMGDLEKFKKDVWLSYFKQHEELYLNLVAKVKSAEGRANEIHDEARRQRTQWEDVVEVFNQRFFVPFKLEVKNRVSVMLGQEPVPALAFVFREGTETAEIDRSDLLQILSTGEKKALYILSVLFEVEARRKRQEPTLFVVDDIADSFDYRNKYAIVQYLRDVDSESCFRQIILTHNFDFFRTLNGRFVQYSNCWMVSRTSAGLELAPAAGVQNVFLKDWKKNFFTKATKRAASIAFMRNLIEYTRGEDDPDYMLLTSLLHWKSDSARITQCDLDAIYSRLFGTPSQAWPRPAELALESIENEAVACLTAPETGNLESKVVLSIAIRLMAERHMIERIDDGDVVGAIDSNQTSKLFSEYKKTPGATPEALKVLDEVLLMTPENIHLNSFMYEPLVDLADDHLRDLYRRVLALE